MTLGVPNGFHRAEFYWKLTKIGGIDSKPGLKKVLLRYSLSMKLLFVTTQLS
jgi:hypothetical protein